MSLHPIEPWREGDPDAEMVEVEALDHGGSVVWYYWRRPKDLFRADRGWRGTGWETSALALAAAREALTEVCDECHQGHGRHPAEGGAPIPNPRCLLCHGAGRVLRREKP